tara:strand:+ start:62 stop:385 length:324 start_codon:yes stop_codon:yes gene_type:complete
MFVVQVKGESMNRRIPNGAWCLFSPDPGGSRQGKIVLVHHSDIQDPGFGGQFTVKRYESEKRQGDISEWQHSVIRLDIGVRPALFPSRQLRRSPSLDEVFAEMLTAE